MAVAVPENCLGMGAHLYDDRGTEFGGNESGSV